MSSGTTAVTASRWPPASSTTPPTASRRSAAEVSPNTALPGVVSAAATISAPGTTRPYVSGSIASASSGTNQPASGASTVVPATSKDRTNSTSSPRTTVTSVTPATLPMAASRPGPSPPVVQTRSGPDATGTAVDGAPVSVVVVGAVVGGAASGSVELPIAGVGVASRSPATIAAPTTPTAMPTTATATNRARLVNRPTQGSGPCRGARPA